MPPKRRSNRLKQSANSNKVVSDVNTQLSESTSVPPSSFRTPPSSYIESDNDLSDSNGFNVSDESNEEDTIRPQRKKRKTVQQKRGDEIRNQLSRSAAVINSNIDDIDDFEENRLFEELSDPNVYITQLAQSWLDEFLTEDLDSKFDALKDFINLLLRLSGCILQLSKHDVEITESAKDTITDVQSTFKRQKFHEFPLLYPPAGVNAKDWREFPENVGSFFTTIISLAGERGAVFNEEFTGLLLEWITVLSTSNIRALRYVSTFCGVRFQTEMCSLLANISESITKSEKQLKEENHQLEKVVSVSTHNRRSVKKVETIGLRIEQIESNIEAFKIKKEKLSDTISEFFNTIFVHRYRDVSSEIRFDCIKHLGHWMSIYPEIFFDVIYMRYLGWTMTDDDPMVRAEAFGILTKLYKKKDTGQALKQFTEFFRTKLIQIAIYESDFNSRFNCFQLLVEIVDKSLLSNDEIIQISSLIFVDDEDVMYQYQGGKAGQVRILKELAKFLSKVEALKYLELFDTSQSLIEELNKSFPIDVKECIKIKTLISILEESYDYYQTNYAFSHAKKRSFNSRFEKLITVSQYMYQISKYNQYDGKPNELFEIYLNYITFDFFSNDKFDTSILELNVSNQSVLLNFIIGASSIYAMGTESQFFRMLFPIQTRRNHDNVYDADHYLTKLTGHLTNWWSMFKDNMEMVTLFTCLISRLKDYNVIDQYNNISAASSSVVSMILHINFPMPKDDAYDSTFYESVTYYIDQLLKDVNPNEGAYRKVIMETTHIFSQEISNKNVNGEQLSRLLILSSNAEAKSIIYQDFGDELLNIIPLLSAEYIHSYLLLLHDYVTFHLSALYKNGLSHHQRPNPIPKSLKIKDICIELSKLIEVDDTKWDIGIVEDIAQKYLSILLTLEAFNSEQESGGVNSTALEASNISSPIRANETFLSLSIDSSLAERLLKLFCVQEYQVAKMNGFEDKLERDEMEDVHFDKYSLQPFLNREENITDSDIGLKSGYYQRVEEHKKLLILNKLTGALCEFAGKLAICESFNLFINDTISSVVLNRLKLNSNLLGPIYSKVLNDVNLLSDESLRAIIESEKNQNFNNNATSAKGLMEEEHNISELEDDPLEHSDDGQNDVIQDRNLSEDREENGNSDEEIPRDGDGDGDAAGDEDDDEDMEFSNIDDAIGPISFKETQVTISSLNSSKPSTNI